MKIIVPLVAIIASFLIGSIPTAYVMGRMKGIDIRHCGSGNVGATNVFRTMGKGWGIVCLILDILKGLIPTAFLFPGEIFAIPLPLDAWQWIIGLTAVAGHMFSPFLRFRGGKGVATSLGVILAIAPWPMLVVLVLGILIIWLTGYVSVASITGAALLPFLILIYYWPIRPWTSVIVTLVLGAVIIWKHRANIQRLRAGTEKRLFERNGRPRQ